MLSFISLIWCQTRGSLGGLEYLDPGYLGELRRLVLEEEAGGRLGQREADIVGQGAESQGSLRERPWTSNKGQIQTPLGGSGRGEAGLPGEQRKRRTGGGQSVECRQEVQTRKGKRQGTEHRENADEESTC